APRTGPGPGRSRAPTSSGDAPAWSSSRGQAGQDSGAMTLEVDADDLPTPRRTLPEEIQLVRQLNAGVGNYQTRQGTLLLGFCQDGYWLLRFAHDPALAGVLEPADHPRTLDWDRVVELLATPGGLEDDDL